MAATHRDTMMHCQLSATGDRKRLFSWPNPVLGIAVFAFALNLAFARSAASGEHDTDAADPDRSLGSVTELEAQAEAEFAKADANGDGGVSVDEFVAAEFTHRPMRPRGGPRMRPGGERGANAPRKSSERDFSTADADGDGQLSPQEFEALPQARREARRRRFFERADADGDGVLSKDEFPSRAGRLAALDANGDGRIDRDELPRRRRP